MSEVERTTEIKVEKPSLLGTIWSPGEQFERIRERPKVWGPLAIIALLFTILSGYFVVMT